MQQHNVDYASVLGAAVDVMATALPDSTKSSPPLGQGSAATYCQRMVWVLSVGKAAWWSPAPLRAGSRGAVVVSMCRMAQQPASALSHNVHHYTGASAAEPKCTQLTLHQCIVTWQLVHWVVRRRQRLDIDRLVRGAGRQGLGVGRGWAVHCSNCIQRVSCSRVADELLSCLVGTNA
jgi:hypothetical protein